MTFRRNHEIAAVKAIEFAADQCREAGKRTRAGSLDRLAAAFDQRDYDQGLMGRYIAGGTAITASDVLASKANTPDQLLRHVLQETSE